MMSKKRNVKRVKLPTLHLYSSGVQTSDNTGTLAPLQIKRSGGTISVGMELVPKGTDSWNDFLSWEQRLALFFFL